MSDIRKNNNEEIQDSNELEQQYTEVDTEDIIEADNIIDNSSSDEEIDDFKDEEIDSNDEDDSDDEENNIADDNIEDEQDIADTSKTNDESLDNTTIKKKPKYISLISVLAVIALLVITDIIPILPNAYNRFYVGNTYQIGETQGAAFDKFGENVLYAGNGVVMSFGADMVCDFKSDAPSGTPKLETAGNNAVIYYANSNDAIYVYGKDKVKPIKTTYEIIASTVNSSGYYGLVTKEPGYKSYIEVFNENGKSIYKFHTNNSIVDIAISDSGKSLVASCYVIDNNEVSGKLIFIDLTSDKPGKEIIVKSNLVSEVKYINKDTAVAFGDLYAIGYTSSGIEKWRIKYGNRVVKSYDISTNGDIGFIFDRYSSELSESTVEVYNSSGKLKGVHNSKDNVKYISANNDYFLLSLDRQTVLLDSGADVVKKKNTSKDYRKAVLYSNYNFAFSITDGISEIMSVKH